MHARGHPPPTVSEHEGSVTWTRTARAARLRVLAGVGVGASIFAGYGYTEGFGLATTARVVGLWTVALAVGAAFVRDVTYRLGPDGVAVRRGRGPERRHAWREFASFRLHGDIASRGRRDLARAADALNARFGEAIYLRHEDSLRLELTLEPTPEVSERACRVVAEALPYRPDAGSPPAALALAVLAVIVVLVVLLVVF